MAKLIACWAFTGAVPPGLLVPFISAQRNPDNSVSFHARHQGGQQVMVHLSEADWTKFLRAAFEELLDA